MPTTPTPGARVPNSTRAVDKTTHTPGPWCLSEVSGVVYYDDPNLGLVSIAIVGSASGASSESRANARLIAAAPDLLAACDAVTTQLRRICDAPATDQVQSHVDHDTLAAIRTACAAITRALGGDQ